MGPISPAGAEGRPENGPGIDLGGTPRRDARLRALAALLLVTALSAWLFGAVLAGGKTFAERDLAAMDRPARAVLTRLWKSFPEVPEWNPYAASGQPFAANPHNAVLYPLTWLFLVLPFDTAFALQVVVPILFSFAGMVLLLLTLGRSRAAALYGGMLWCFGGVVLSATNLLPVLFTLAPVPLVLALFVRVVRERRLVDWLLLVPAFALSCAGGEPVSLLAEGVLIGCAWLATARGGDPAMGWRHRLGISLVPLAALLAGAAVAAPVLVPGARLEAKTAREEGLPFERATVWSFPPSRLAELALPLAYGDTGSKDASRYWGSSLYPGRSYPLLYSIYAGALTPLLALLGLGTTRRAWAWAAVAVGGLAFAFGRHTPLFALAYLACPPLRMLRYPEKWMVVPALALVVLAAGGFDALVGGTRRCRRAAFAYLVTLAAAAALLAGTVAVLTHVHGPAWWGSWLVSAAGSTAFATTFPTAAAMQAATAVAGIASVWLLRRRGRDVGMAALFVLAAVDLGRNGHFLLGTAEPAALATPPPVYAGLVARPSPPRLYHAAQWQDLDPRVEPELFAPPAPAQWRIPTALERDYDLTQLRWSRRAAALIATAAAHDPRLLDPLLARRGVGAVLGFRADAPPSGPGGERLLPRGQVLLRGVPAPRPEAFCVTRIARFGSDADWLAAVERLGAANRDAALLEHGVAPELPDAPSPCAVTLVHAAPDRLSLELDARGPGRSLLAINRTWEEWWSAQLDGASIALFRTDVNLMAVAVPPGRHSLTVVYRDLALTWSIRGSLMILGAWLVVSVAVTLEARRRPGP